MNDYSTRSVFNSRLSLDASRAPEAMTLFPQNQ